MYLIFAQPMEVLCVQLEQLLNILHYTESPNHNNETQRVSPDDAETGEAIAWGSYRDKRTVKRLSRLFTTNLGTLAEQKNWRLSQESIILPELLSNISYPDEDKSYLRAIFFFLIRVLVNIICSLIAENGLQIEIVFL